jgi:hypothetical protein
MLGGSWDVWGEVGMFGGKLECLGGSWDVWEMFEGEASPLPLR